MLVMWPEYYNENACSEPAATDLLSDFLWYKDGIKKYSESSC